MHGWAHREDHPTQNQRTPTDDPYDANTGTAQWRRMDSHGESILSGLSSDSDDNRMRGSPESLRRGAPLISVAEEDNDNAEEATAYDSPYDAEPSDDDIEWELQQHGLYLGGCPSDIRE